LTFVTRIVILVITMSVRRKPAKKPPGPEPAAPPGPDRGRPRDPGRRRRVLDVARAHFARLGFKNTRLDAIAEEAGCAKGALYLEFESKEALLQEVAREVLEDAGKRYALHVMSLPSPLERLRETVRFTYREMEREPLFARLMRDDPDLRALRPEHAVDEQQQKGEQQVAMLRAWVEEGIQKGEIRPDADAAAVPFIISILRAVYPHAQAATGGLFSRERLLDAVVDMFARSLATPREINQTSNNPTRA
jgi:TetR/AcrR family transcriptional regulator, cholesterol catabolism regulator